MTLFDLVILGVVAGLAIGGYRLGFVTRVTSWIGLAIGIAVASWAAPKVLDTLPRALGMVGDLDPGSRLVIVGGAFVVIASLGGALGTTVGASIRRVIPAGPLRQVDRVAGAVAGALGALVLVWLFLPALSEVPGSVSRQARNSVIAQALDTAVPRPPPSLQALRQAVRDANFPQVFNDLGPSPRTGTPPPADVLAPAVQARVKASTVLVSGVACGRLLKGSGFSPAADVIVTNAHVVAGERSTKVERPDGTVLTATVQVFDPQRDLAVLSVPDLSEPVLDVASAKIGDQGAVFGHPEGQEQVDVQPARVDDRRTATGRDLYNSAVTSRDVLFLAARLAPGDSGGAFVNNAGAVVGVAFAIAPDEPSTAYALSDKELRAVLAQPRARSVGTGACVG